VAGPATVTYTTGSLVAWGVAIVIGCAILCFISYHSGYRSGYRKGENKAVRDIDSMEQRSLKQKLNDYRRTQSRPNIQNRNRSKKK